MKHRELREHPDLDQLKRQAKELLEAYLSGEHGAVSEVNTHYRAADPARFALHDAQLVIARAYGFESWPKLKARVDGVTVSRLCEAVDRGDIDTARALLQRRPEIVDFEWPGHGEMGALHVAVLRRDAALVELLMQCGADARRGIWPNRDATSPRTLAIERGYGDIVAIIAREEGRRPIAPPPAAPPALAQAMQQGGEERVMEMIGADPEIVKTLRKPLHTAACMLLEPVATWLLDRGADPNLADEHGWTPIEMAAGAWRPAHPRDRIDSMARLLLARGARLTPRAAVALGEAGWLKAEHAKGNVANPRLCGMWHFGGLLATAVDYDRPEMLELLLDLGFDPDERVRVAGADEPQFSASEPLYNCVNGGKIDMARMLLARGADPNAQVYAAGSPTYRAHQLKSPAMVDLLTEHGGWIDAASVGYLRRADLARKMLAGELDPHLENGTFSGISLAEQLLWSGASGGDAEIVRMSLELIDWPRDDPRWFWKLWRPLPGHEPWDAELHEAFLDCFRQILARCDPNLRADFGQSMLHEAASRGHGDADVAIGALLLEAGARTDIRDHFLKSTPLGWACRWGRAGLVKLLLAHGADPVEADAEPWATPRAWAQKAGREDLLPLLDAVQ